MYIDLPILFIVVCRNFYVFNLLFCMSVKSLKICIILFYVLFFFRKYLFYCIRTTVSGDYISHPVSYRSNFSLEIPRSLNYSILWVDCYTYPTKVLSLFFFRINRRLSGSLLFYEILFIPFFLYYLPNPSAREGYDTRSIFKRSLTGLNSEVSFS